MKDAAKTGPIILVAFGLLMAVHFGVTFAFTRADTTTHLLLAGAAAAPLLVGLATLVFVMRRPADPAAPLVVTRLSVPTALLGFAITALVVGAVAGEWLILIGAGMAALAFAGLVRERRTRPR